MTTDTLRTTKKAAGISHEPPKLVAVVDIGATSIRMAIAEIGDNGEIRTLEHLAQAVSLGKDTFTKGSIDSSTTEECVRVLKDYRQLLNEYGVKQKDRVHVVATSAVREATNRLSFLERIYVATGFHVEPFDEAAVNRVTYLGILPVLASQPKLAESKTLVIEVGGGSTEVLLVQGRDVIFAQTYRMGALRARKTLEAYRAPTGKFRKIMESQIHRLISQVRRHVTQDEPLTMIALGGDVRFATSQLQPDWDMQSLARVKVANLAKFTDYILGLSIDEIVRKYHLAFPEAEAVGPALLAYGTAAEALGLQSIRVSSVNLRDALIKSMASHQAWTADFADQIVRSALDMGRRFRFDEPHARHVAHLCKTLCQALKAELKANSRFDVILNVAALLHDVGYAVNPRSHHKHSMYLINNGELFGLTKKDLHLAALTARYHRRASPKQTHEGYASLDWESRTNVAKMAAILRVADALDRSNTQRIKGISCSQEDGRLVVSVPIADDLSLEQLALRQKGGLFKEVFGMSVLLRNAPELQSEKGAMPDNMANLVNRELSWLEFNQRVLDEATSRELPLLERVKFLAITDSNLDEFFMVRVGGLRMLKKRGSTKRDVAGMTVTEQLDAVSRCAHQMANDQYACLIDQLEPQLAKAGIRRVTQAADEHQQAVVKKLFDSEVFTVYTPMAIFAEDEFPLLASGSLNMAVRLEPAPDSTEPRFAIIPMANSPTRLFRLPSDNGYQYILLEDVVSQFIERFFPGERVAEVAPFRITRNADMTVREDMATDLMAGMEEVLDARKESDCVRLEVSDSVSDTLLAFLVEGLHVDHDSIYRARGPLDLSAFFRLTGITGFDELKAKSWPPRRSPDVDLTKSMFDTVRRQDIMLTLPYQSFEPVVRFIEEAAEDPDVLAIKIILYRTSRNSPIVAALRRASEMGKHVTALVELKARFDEARNIEWAKNLEQEGGQVIYGVKGLKTHAKVCIVIRREAHGIQRYVHFATGNYNEVTAKLYSDISFLTCNEELAADATSFFNAISGYSQPHEYRKLAAAPFDLRARLVELIDGEIERCRQGQPARIMAQLNSLACPYVISALYDASQAGVQIDLNVRGICCLKPGVPGLSDNIRVVSILDRFLEHSRIVYFHHGGDKLVFISSADWMPRNLDKRVELLVPIEDRSSRDLLIAILKSYARDNVKGRVILADGGYKRPRVRKGKKAHRHQEHMYHLAREAEKMIEQSQPTVFEPHRAADTSRQA